MNKYVTGFKKTLTYTLGNAYLKLCVCVAFFRKCSGSFPETFRKLSRKPHFPEVFRKLSRKRHFQVHVCAKYFETVIYIYI